MNFRRKNVARLVMTGAAVVALGLTGSGSAMAATGHELPSDRNHQCGKTGKCHRSGAP
jgi:hypothetical protein